MILSNGLSVQSRYGNGLSIDTCFPEIKSVTNSSCKSFGEDDVSTGVCSDDDISLKDAFGPGFFYHANYGPSSKGASGNQNSHLQPPQAISSSIDFFEARGPDAHVVLDPSIWPMYASSDQVPSTSAELSRAAADDSAGFAQPAVSLSQPGVVSGMLCISLILVLC